MTGSGQELSTQTWPPRREVEVNYGIRCRGLLAGIGNLTSMPSRPRGCNEQAVRILVLPPADWLRAGDDHWHLSAIRVGEQAGTESRPRLVAGAVPRLHCVGSANHSPRCLLFRHD